MEKEALINAACPQCGMLYELPSEYRGQVAECSGCGSEFKIKPAEVLVIPDAENSEEADNASEMTDTGTVKISRRQNKTS